MVVDAVLIAQSGPDAGKSFTLVQGDNLIVREPGISGAVGR